MGLEAYRLALTGLKTHAHAMAGFSAPGMARKHTIGALCADIAGPGALGKAGAAVIPDRLPSHGQAAAMQHRIVCIATRRRTGHCLSKTKFP